MRTIDDVIESSIDQMVKEQSGFFESQVRAYLPAISKRLQEDLDTCGYVIVPKPVGDHEKPHASRHHGK